MFSNIPQELRDLNQWVCWRLEFAPPMVKPTKMPYTPRPNSGKANVNKPETWGSFIDASSAPLTCVQAAHPDAPIGETGFTGIGFVFTPEDDYTGIDCDDCQGDQEIYAFQQQVYFKFNSYTEYSPSRNGIHIIVKGKVPTGRRRKFVELYPQGRFFTMTGDVLNNVPVRECQEELDWLYPLMGKDVSQFIKVEAATEQSEEDEEVIERGRNAVNGEKFSSLYDGNWHHLYPSQSEADFALIDMLAFYTKYPPQIKRLFRASMLGQRDKAQRDDYLDYMIEKSFDNQLPQIDIDVFSKAVADNVLASMKANVAAGATGEPGKADPYATTAATTLPEGGQGNTLLHNNSEGVNSFPPGLLGEIAAYLYATAPRPAIDIALAGAIGFMAGITGRAYNVSGTGLNQYILMLAPTGIGKDAVASGVSKLTSALVSTCPSIVDFKGPGELVSSAGLIKWLANAKNPCIISILGEFGKKMKEMSSPNANAHLVGLSRVLLQMYSKSGYGEVFDPMAYSDKDKNTAPLQSPSLTIFSESVPESFYESLDESMVGDGLLPRFMVFESKGHRPKLNKNREVKPPVGLVSKLNDLTAHCLSVMHRHNVHNVNLSPEAERLFDDLDTFTTDIINNSTEVPRQLWNRADLKAMKLASLRAIGENYLNPVVSAEHAMWAIGIVTDQINKMIAKFETGQVGAAASTGEIKQIGEIIKAFKTFLYDHDKYEKYGGNREMIAQNIVTEAAIQRKIACLACFRNDRMGATFAMKRALKTMIEADEIREVPPSQMFARFGMKPKAFVIANAARFTDDLFNP